MSTYSKDTSDMKIYFCGSITGGREDADLYSRLVEQLSKYGNVLSAHVGRKDVAKFEEGNSAHKIHDRDIAWVTESDVVVAEVTQPSHGVGYEIGRAVAMKKKILCLFRPSSGKKLSAMIAGADNGNNCLVKEYEEQEASQIFEEFFKKC